MLVSDGRVSSYVFQIGLGISVRHTFSDTGSCREAKRKKHDSSAKCRDPHEDERTPDNYGTETSKRMHAGNTEQNMRRMCSPCVCAAKVDRFSKKTAVLLITSFV